MDKRNQISTTVFKYQMIIFWYCDLNISTHGNVIINPVNVVIIIIELIVQMYFLEVSYFRTNVVPSDQSFNMIYVGNE